MPRISLVIMLGMIWVLGGCGGSHESTVAISGKVLLPDGKPVPGARVVFESEKQINAEGMTNDNGEYKLTTFKPGDGAVVGSHKVIVIHQPPRPAHDEASGQPLPPEPPSLVAPEFGRYTTSGLTVVVEKGKTTGYDLAVKPPK